MPGVAGKSGRRRGRGKVYRFDFYYRLVPGEDPPELEELLESILQTRGRKRRDIIRAALLSGSRQARETAERVEDSESMSLFDDMFDNF